MTTVLAPLATAIRNRAIPADNRATRIYLRATTADRREIGIYRQEIASEWWPRASTSQEMAVNIEAIAGYAHRNADAAVGRQPAAGLRLFQPETPHFRPCRLPPIAYPPSTNIFLPT